MYEIIDKKSDLTKRLRQLSPRITIRGSAAHESHRIARHSQHSHIVT